MSGRSACPSCGAVLRTADLVPLLSWLLSRRRCRHCGAAIDAFYPLVEIGAAAVGALAVLLVDGPLGVVAALLGWWLLGLALVDLAVWRLPDVMTLPLIVLGLAAAGLGVGLPELGFVAALSGAFLGYAAFALLALAYRRLRGREGLGLGDAKLLAAAGAWVGPSALPWVVFGAAVLGLLGILALRRPVTAATALPFGPALAAATWIVFLLLARGSGQFA